MDLNEIKSVPYNKPLFYHDNPHAHGISTAEKLRVIFGQVLFFAMIRLWQQNKTCRFLDNRAVTCIFRQIAFPVLDLHSYFFWCDILLATS
jgi:hypothetical protein